MKLTVNVRDVLAIFRHQEALWRVRVAMEWAVNVDVDVEVGAIRGLYACPCLGTRQAFCGESAELGHGALSKTPVRINLGEQISEYLV